MAFERAWPAASEASRQASAAGHPCRGGVAAEQRLVGDDQVDRDRDGDLGGASGDAFDEGVGHDLAASATVGAGVGFSLQRCVHRDAVGHGQQRGHVRHGVGGGSDGDGAFGFGAYGAVDDGPGVQCVGDGLGVGFDALVSLAVQGPQVGAHPGVQGAAVRYRQAGRFAHDEGGPPLGEGSGLQGGQGVGHLVDQGLGEPEVPAAAVRGVVAGQGDLTGQSLTALGRRHPGFGLGGAAHPVEFGGRDGLLGRGRGLLPLQAGDPGHQGCFVIEHVFD